MDFVKRKILRINTSTSSEGDIVYQSWLLHHPPARGLKKYLHRSHWRWTILRYTGPEEGVMEMYTNDTCSRMASKIRITRNYKVDSGMSFNPDGATSQLNMFCIRTERQVHYLVAETQAEAEQWVLAICTTCGLDIPRRPKSPSPPEPVSDRQIRRPRAKSETLPPKIVASSEGQLHAPTSDTNYILLSECYVTHELTKKLPKRDAHSVSERQGENLCLSSNHLNYDHPRPIHQRSRHVTSPDLSDIVPDPPQAVFSNEIYNYPRKGQPIKRHPNLENMPVFPAATNYGAYDTPQLRVICAQQTEVSVRNADIEKARAEATHAALELEDAISRNTVTEMLHSSVSPASSEVFMPDFFPFDIRPENPPPRPPKPPHLRQDVIPWDGRMIQVDVVCPIYDTVPQPRPVRNLMVPDKANKGNCNISANDLRNKGCHQNEYCEKGRQFLRSTSSEIAIPLRPSQPEFPATIKISPNTRVPGPIGDFGSNHVNYLYDTPKPPGFNNDSRISANDITKGVIMRRRPPTPPSQNLKHSVFPLDIDGVTDGDSNNKRTTSLTEEQVQPLTQKQRISICNEVNYLDLAFTANAEDFSPKTLTRETVYYSVDFIRTWAFNETRQNVEEIYRNT